MKKYCRCDIESAIYNDFGNIKCQYCGGVVSEERAEKFTKYNNLINNK